MSCGSLDASSSARYPVRFSTASTNSPSSSSRRDRKSSIISTNAAMAFSERAVQHRHSALGGRLQRVVEAGAGVFGVHRDARLGAVADAASWCVQDPPHAHRVAGVVEHPQVGDDVANLLALVEPYAADHLVRDAGADEHLFQRARRVVGAVEHRDIVVGDVAAVGETVDFACDESGFVVLVLRDIADDELPLAGVGPQPLLAAAALRVMTELAAVRMFCVER